LYDDEEDLHQFRVNIRKSRAFLKEFAFLFPAKEHDHFNEKLSDFASLTNQKRDLDVINERLIALDDKHDDVQVDIRRQQKRENQKITQMLKGKDFEQFFDSYQSILKDQTLVNVNNSTGSIEDTAKKVLQDLHIKIVKKIDALEKKFSIKTLHKIRISLKKYRYLLEEFQHIFGDKKIKKMIEKGKSLQTILGDFNDTVNQKKLLHTYFKSTKKKITDRKELESKLLKKTAKTQKNLLSQAMKKLQKFKKQGLNL
jgi:CHAD domain-containing protein